MNLLRLKIYCKYLLSRPTNITIKTNKPKIYIFLAADYGNLGDIAITYAQHKYLNDKFKEYEIVEIPISKTLTGIKGVRKIINKTDVITIIGGGNISDLYDDIEFLRQLVISNFPKNRIISFPQSVDFSNTKFGNKRLNTAIKIYSKHKNLTLAAREEKSYQFLLKHFSNNNIIKIPDIAFTLNYNHQGLRESLTICLRNDLEKSNSSDITNLIHSFEQDKIKYYDTHVGNIEINHDNRMKYLNEIWNTFSSSKLIITDRLHGMIFAYITRTPAIVFDNTNNKISQSYEWIKDCGFIHLYTTDTDILSIHHNYFDIQSRLNNEIDKILNYIK